MTVPGARCVDGRAGVLTALAPSVQRGWEIKQGHGGGMGKGGRKGWGEEEGSLFLKNKLTGGKSDLNSPGCGCHRELPGVTF